MSRMQNSLFVPNDHEPARLGRRQFLQGSVVTAPLALIPGAALAATKTTKKKATSKTATTGGTKASSGSAWDIGKELAVMFTFATTDGGFRVHDPYVAVFIEDSTGALVRTIDLSIETGRGLRYVDELRHWYNAANGGDGLVDTISSATRIPGTYNVVWDGRSEKKALVPLGEYYVCIEAAGERGPYELIREPITVGTTAFTKKFADSGELSSRCSSACADCGERVREWICSVVPSTGSCSETNRRDRRIPRSPRLTCVPRITDGLRPWNRGKGHTERGPSAGCLCEGDRAVVTVHDGRHDRQPEARAATAARP